MKKVLLLCLLINLSFAQEFKFGKVPENLINQTEHPHFKESDAAIIYKRTSAIINYENGTGFEVIYETNMRIKIYNGNALDNGTISLMLRKSNSKEKSEDLFSVKGLTINGSSDTDQFKLEKENINKSEVNKYRDLVTINFPQVKSGSVIDFSYKKSSPYFWYIDEFYFQESIPVDYADYKVSWPEFFAFTPIQKGYLNINNTNNSKSQKDKWAYNMMEVNMSNVAPMKEEPMTDNIENYMTSLRFELTSMYVPGTTVQNFTTTWDKIAENYEKDAYEDFLKPSKRMIEFVSGFKFDNNDIPNSLANYMKSNFKWNGYFSEYPDNDINKLTSGGVNSGTLNGFLLTALNAHNIKAVPVVISTRDNGLAHPYGNPSTYLFNHMIVGIQDNAGNIKGFIDVTDKWGGVNCLSLSNLNQFGMAVINEKANWLKIVSPNSSDNIIIEANLDKNGKLSGVVKLSSSQLYGYKLKDQNDLNSLKEMRKKEMGVSDVKNFKVDGFDIPVVPVIEEISFDNVQLEKVGSQYIFNPMMFYQTKLNPFTSNDRKYPIDFDTPFTNRFIANISIPSGAEIEQSVNPMNLKLDEVAKYSYLLNVKENKLSLSKVISISEPIIPAENYQGLKKFYDNIVNTEAQSVLIEMPK